MAVPPFSAANARGAAATAAAAAPVANKVRLVESMIGSPLDKRNVKALRPDRSARLLRKREIVPARRRSQVVIAISHSLVLSDHFVLAPL